MRNRRFLPCFLALLALSSTPAEPLPLRWRSLPLDDPLTPAPPKRRDACLSSVSTGPPLGSANNNNNNNTSSSSSSNAAPPIAFLFGGRDEDGVSMGDLWVMGLLNTDNGTTATWVELGPFRDGPIARHLPICGARLIRSHPPFGALVRLVVATGETYIQNPPFLANHADAWSLTVNVTLGAGSIPLTAVPLGIGWQPLADVLQADPGGNGAVVVGDEGYGSPRRRYGAGGGVLADGRVLVTHGLSRGHGRVDDAWVAGGGANDSLPSDSDSDSSAGWAPLVSEGKRPLPRCLVASAVVPAVPQNATTTSDDGNGGEKLVMFGGCSSGHGVCPQEDTWVMDTLTGGWTQADSCPRASTYAAMVALPGSMVTASGGDDRGGNGGKVLLYGGSHSVGSSSFGSYAVLDTLGGGGGTWKRYAYPGEGSFVPAGRESHAMAVVAGRVVVFGGALAGGSVSAELLSLGGPGEYLEDGELAGGGCETRFHFYYVHGILNVCALWGLSFAATCTAHFGRQWRHWLVVHAGLHTLSLLAVVAAVVVVWHTQETHLDRTHKVMGIVSLGSMVVQASMGLGSATLRGKPGLYATHRAFGRTLTLASIASIVLGILALNTSETLLIAVSAWIGVALCGFIAGDIVVARARARSATRADGSELYVVNRVPKGFGKE